ncbi:MAG: hypothetical protein A2X23_01670 [Chloroflexi bacterium GWC2_73_18]|nr:MAG: hypothetical protein A2X23_01670 [Chloroflexi bacterium GWC2_73_18]
MDEWRSALRCRWGRGEECGGSHEGPSSRRHDRPVRRSRGVMRSVERVTVVAVTNEGTAGDRTIRPAARRP